MAPKRKAKNEVSGRHRQPKQPRIVSKYDQQSSHSTEDEQQAPTSKVFANGNENATGAKTEPGPLPDPPKIKDEKLRRMVFTHQGTISKKDNNAMPEGYETLEWLGDAYVELIATRFIFEEHLSTPGHMSQVRESLVKNETIGGFSAQYGFDQKLYLRPELRGNAKLMTKIRGDIFEAYVGAVIKSDPQDGFRKAEDWLTMLWTPLLQANREPVVDLNAKAELARKISGKGIVPRYVDEKPMVQGKGGMQTHFIGIYLTGWGWKNHHLGSGTGSSKTLAGCAAAMQALANPITDEMNAVKRAFDAKAKGEKGDGAQAT